MSSHSYCNGLFDDVAAFHPYFCKVTSINSWFRYIILEWNDFFGLSSGCPNWGEQMLVHISPEGLRQQLPTQTTINEAFPLHPWLCIILGSYSLYLTNLPSPPTALHLPSCIFLCALFLPPLCCDSKAWIDATLFKLISDPSLSPGNFLQDSQSDVLKRQIQACSALNLSPTKFPNIPKVRKKGSPWPSMLCVGWLWSFSSYHSSSHPHFFLRV